MLLMLQASPSGAVAKTPSLSEIGSPATPSSSLACFFSDVPVSPLLTRPTPSAKEMLASSTPLPAYIKWEAGNSVMSLWICLVQGLFACMQCVYRLLQMSYHYWACMA